MKPITLKDELFNIFNFGYTGNDAIEIFQFSGQNVKPDTIKRNFRLWLEENYTTFPIHYESPYQYIVRDGKEFIPPSSRQRVHLIYIRYNYEEHRPEFLIEFEDGSRQWTKRHTLFDDAPVPSFPVRIFRSIRSYFLYH